MGNVGNTGNVGNAGNVGYIGSVGNVGNTGNVDIVGNTGNIGNVGNTGNVYNTGKYKLKHHILVLYNKIQHLGCSLVANTALGFALCCIFHLTPPLVLYCIVQHS